MAPCGVNVQGLHAATTKPVGMGRAVVVVVIVDCYEFQPDQVVHFYFAPAVCYTGKTAGKPS